MTATMEMKPESLKALVEHYAKEWHQTTGTVVSEMTVEYAGPTVYELGQRRDKLGLLRRGLWQWKGCPTQVKVPVLRCGGREYPREKLRVQ